MDSKYFKIFIVFKFKSFLMIKVIVIRGRHRILIYLCMDVKEIQNDQVPEFSIELKIFKIVVFRMHRILISKNDKE